MNRQTDDTWSAFHDELVRPVEAKAEKAKAKAMAAPSARTAGVDWDGNEGEIRTGAVEQQPSDWDDLLRKMEMDPAEVEIHPDYPIRHSAWEVPGHGMMHSYRARIRRRSSVQKNLDFEQLAERISNHRPPEESPPFGENAFVVCTGDTQIGKEGTEATIDRFLKSLSTVPARLRELRKSGRSLGSIFSPWLGDCLTAETEIVTRQYGIVPIGDVSGQFVDIKDANGGWVNVQIKSYGLKPITEVSWRSLRASKTVRVSNGHEWVLRDGTRWRTDELKPGMSVTKGYRRKGNFPALSQTGVQAGFIYGDGTATGNGCRAIFCGDKDEALMSWFPGVQISERDGKNQRRTASRFPESWKSVPAFTEGTSYLYGWLAGYFAADGCVDTHGGARLSSASPGNLEFVRSVCAILGIDTYPIREVSENATGRFNDSKMYEISLSLRSLPDEFFLIPVHRERTKSSRMRPKKSPSWVVESVRDTGTLEETFCCEVPTTSSFLLADGLLTSNCIEHVVGSYASQTATTELSLTEQLRVLKRLAWKQIEVLAPLTHRLVVPIIPGNHDMAVRKGGEQLGHHSDSFAYDLAAYLHDLTKVNPDVYGHVEIVVPERKSLVVTQEMCGTLVAMAHGHQFPSGAEGVTKWWMGQAHGMQPAGDATLLLAAHRHHLDIRQLGRKTFIQIPALDSGSQWWVNRSGQESPAGIVTLTVGASGWDDLKILY